VVDVDIHQAGERSRFLQRVHEAVARWTRHDGTLMLVLVDVDRLGLVNETLGYATGDALLAALAARLHDRVRAGDLVARLGADVAVLCTSPQGVSDHAVATVAERIRIAVEEPIDVSGRSLFLQASIGISTARPGVGGEGLLREAERAAALAKRRGGGHWQLADPEAATRTVAVLDVEHGLRRAIANGELVVHYQPIVQLDTGAIAGVEALVRWAPPEGGLVPPGQFIAVAEDSGLIVPLGRWVLEEVAHQATAHPLLSGAVTGKPLTVAVNVSPRQLGRPGLPRLVAGVVQRAGVDPAQLCFELTESALVPDVVEAGAILDELKAIGCAIAIDDFGTGWSSLSHLKHFPVDALKIDRSFVEGLVRPGGDRAIAEVIVNLAHSLGMAAVAEGVETDAQLAVLRAIGCDHVQGFKLAPPMPLDDLTAEVKQWP
jgi:diguanylate cyclase (GGDEF)-like protein